MEVVQSPSNSEEKEVNQPSEMANNRLHQVIEICV